MGLFLHFQPGSLRKGGGGVIRGPWQINKQKGVFYITTHQFIFVVLIHCIWHTVTDLVWISLFGELEGGQVSFCFRAQLFSWRPCFQLLRIFQYSFGLFNLNDNYYVYFWVEQYFDVKMLILFTSIRNGKRIWSIRSTMDLVLLLAVGP